MAFQPTLWYWSNEAPTGCEVDMLWRSVLLAVNINNIGQKAGRFSQAYQSKTCIGVGIKGVFWEVVCLVWLVCTH